MPEGILIGEIMVALPCSTNIVAEPEKPIPAFSTSSIPHSFSFYMPEECLIEILARLPVKSLLRFKSVCKTWLSIISDPSFTKSQLQHAMIASRTNPTLAIISNHPQNHFINEAFLDVNRHYFASSPIIVDGLVIPRQFGSYCIDYKSCNGIICLRDRHDTIYLWNPSIRQYLTFPDVPEQYTKQIYTFHLGFGYDSISGAYKVFRFMFEGIGDNVLPVVLVYSTTTGCWKEIQAPILENKFLCMNRTDIVVDGVLYVDCEDVMISLDLHEEVLGLVPFPEFVERKESPVLDFEGSVAVVFDSVLWTLDDVSGKASWTKRFSVKEYNSGITIWLSYYLGAGLFYGLSESESGFLYNILYDCEKKKVKCFLLPRDTAPETMKYTETLVSLDGFQYIN